MCCHPLDKFVLASKARIHPQQKMAHTAACHSRQGAPSGAMCVVVHASVISTAGGAENRLYMAHS